jgi:hypothetical protein
MARPKSLEVRKPLSFSIREDTFEALRLRAFQDRESKQSIVQRALDAFLKSAPADTAELQRDAQTDGAG